MSPRLKLAAAALALAALALALRLPFLAADPPAGFDIQFASDEGWWVHNARNRVLFGRWIIDDFNQSLFVSPTYCLSAALAFRLLGVGFFSARLPSALAGALLPLAALWGLARTGQRRAGLAAGLLLAASQPLVLLSRTAFVDVLMLLFATAGWAAWTARRGPFGAWAAGAGWALACLTKSYAAFLAPVMLTIAVLELRERGMGALARLARDLALFALAVAMVLGVYWWWMVRPHAAQFRVMYDLWLTLNLPQGPLHSLRNLGGTFAHASGMAATRREFWGQAAALLGAGWLALAALLAGGRGAAGGRRDGDHCEGGEEAGGEEAGARAWRRAALAWAFWAAATLLPLTYKPMRRYVILLPPLAVLAALAFAGRHRLDLAGLWRPPPGPRAPWRAAAGYFMLAVPAAVLLTAPLASAAGPFVKARLADLPFGAARGVQLESVLTAAAAAAFALAGLAFLGLRRLAPRRPLPVRLGPGLLAALVLLFDLAPAAAVLATPRHSLRDLSRKLGEERFGPETVVFGGLADSLCLENRAFAFPYWGRHEAGRILNERPIERFRPDYLLVTRRLGVAWPAEARYQVLVRPENYLETLSALPVADGWRLEADLYLLDGVEDQAVVTTGPTVLL